MPETAIHILITLIVIPVVLFLFQRFVSKADDARKELDKQWHASVTNKFDEITKKISSYCADNHKEHDEIYTKVNTLTNKVGAIETIHHQRGCDQPYRRREGEAI
jgi:uncharacterized protein YpmS